MPVPTLFQDAFARPNGDVNATFQAYVESPGTTWSVSGSLLVCTTNGAFLAVQCMVPADCRIVAYEQNTAGVWGVFARGGGTYGGISDTYYRADLNGTTLTLRKSVAGTLTTIGSTVTVTRAAGAQLMLDCVGSTLQVWYGVVPVLVKSATDTDIAGASATQSAGLWNGSTTAVNIAELDVQADRTWLWGPPNGWTLTEQWHNIITEYTGGDIQRLQVWRRQKNVGKFQQAHLNDTQFAAIKSFFSLCRGQLQPFLIQDPTWAFLASPQISQRTFAIADGVNTLYKVDIDKAASITTYTDGTVDASQPLKSLLTGIIQYSTPPYAGAVLTYDAVTPYWRMYFAKDELVWVRHIPNFWTLEADIVQDKSLLEGVPA